jgi:predicted amidophosphoribosyltransferase
VDRCLALLAFEGAGADLVAGIKYRNRRTAVPALGRAMAALVVAAGGDAAAVTWIPTTPAHRRARGFDHGQLLARHVAAHLHLPCRRLLVRGAGPAQTGRSRAERLAGPHVAAVRAASGLVVAVDDVVTTGSTASAAATALAAAGATAVWVVAAARRAPQADHAP